jgi:hypothetical protein
VLVGKGTQGLQVPWGLGSKKQFFWTHYLENTVVPGMNSGAKAWSKLVPFRWKIPVEEVKYSCKPGKLNLEAFIYSHGIAIMVTDYCYEEGSLEKAVERALKIRWQECFEVVWRKGDAAIKYKLDELVDQAFSFVHQFALGAEKAKKLEHAYRKPFTIAAVVKGNHAKENQEPAEDIQKALNAFVNWPKYDWQNPPPGNMPNLDDARINMKENYQGDVLYGSKMGRVIWAPSRFMPPKPDKPKSHVISCYARNLSLLSMQIESLGDFVLKCVEEPPSAFTNYQDAAVNAIKNLSFLYKGERTTYRSMSAHEQIRQNKELWQALNKTRLDIWGKPPMDPGDWLIPND